MDESARLLSTKAAMVGIHPEGTRNKGDPYTLLPAQPGAGRVAIRARTPVIPAFVLGMTNNLWSLFKRNWSKNGAPIYVVFGPPMNLEDLYIEGDRPPTHKKIADRMCQTISALGEEQRRWEHG
jgi:1-acyl-sn-glycerol-3-phosphate acyltransferase